MTTLIVCVLAFWMGYSVNQGSTCAVATAHEILHHLRFRLFIGLLAASAAAGLTAVPLVWSDIGSARLAATVGVSRTLLIGAALFGIGAVINGACLLGSLGRLGEGELRLALLPAGLAAGLLLVDATGLSEGRQLRNSVLVAPSTIGYAAVAAFAVALAATLALVAGTRPARRQSGRWPLGVSMLVLGVTGGALYATAPAWTYADLVHRSLPLATSLDGGVAVMTVAATIAGAVAAAHRRKRWRPRSGTLSDAARTLAGSVLMGTGAALIPGGNDGLILAAIPALSPGGALAYLVMLATIMAALAIGRSLHRRPSRAAEQV